MEPKIIAMTHTSGRVASSVKGRMSAVAFRDDAERVGAEDHAATLAPATVANARHGQRWYARRAVAGVAWRVARAELPGRVRVRARAAASGPRRARRIRRPTRMQADTPDEVLARLDGIVDRCGDEQSAVGYFAALYRQVTRDVQGAIIEGRFDDTARMERLDVVFANRYLRAEEDFREGRVTTAAWNVALRAAGEWWPTVLQHLLMGMNAHINLDLGIAAAQVAPGSDLADLEADFGRINAILSARVDGVQAALARIWPLLRWLDLGAGGSDEAVVNFSIRRARDHAWTVAVRLAGLAADRRAAEIERLDRHVAAIGRGVHRPGWWLGTKLRLVRLGERGTVHAKIAELGL
jgi:hypothetical protein